MRINVHKYITWSNTEWYKSAEFSHFNTSVSTGELGLGLVLGWVCTVYSMYSCLQSLYTVYCTVSVYTGHTRQVLSTVDRWTECLLLMLACSDLETNFGCGGFKSICLNFFSIPFPFLPCFLARLFVAICLCSFYFLEIWLWDEMYRFHNCSKILRQDFEFLIKLAFFVSVVSEIKLRLHFKQQL